MEGGQDGRSTEFSSCPPPWIVFHCNDSEKSHAFLSIARNNLQVHTIPELRDNKYLTTPIGWLFLLNPETLNASLFNPKNGEKIALPPMKEDINREASCCLISGNPRGEICLVVVGDEEKQSIQFYRLGDTEWTQYELYANCLFSRAALVEETLYVKSSYPVLSTVKISHTNRQPISNVIEAAGRDPLLPLNGYMTCLVESCKELFQVDFIDEFASDTEFAHVLVRKWDSSSLVWNEVKDIGDQIFFFDCSTSAALLHAKQYGLKGNCIYLLKDDNMHLYVFDLEEGTIMEKNLEYSWKDWKPFSTISWLMPVTD